MMALFSVFHRAGPFFVPLVMAYVALALAYLIGRTSSNRLTGLFAAALVAVEPVFAVSAVQPMSDVPAACWLLAAICAVDTGNAPCPERSPGSRSIWSNMTAGICAGMAILTRPVLLPAVLVFLPIHLLRTQSRSAWVCCRDHVSVSAVADLVECDALRSPDDVRIWKRVAHVRDLVLANCG